MAFFCYIRPSTLKIIKGCVDREIGTVKSQGRVVDILALFAGRMAEVKRPIA